MPLHRVVKDSNTPADDLDRIVRRLEGNGARVLQVIEQPAEWLILTEPRSRVDVEVRDGRLGLAGGRAA